MLRFSIPCAMNTKNLYSAKDSKEFYEDRYSKGYMEEWCIEKKQRIIEVIKSLDLSEYGEALDFGCGNGVLTDVIKDALPWWDVYGCDISDIAIQNASKRFPMCRFFTNNDQKYADNKFDFIFSHHVLEHVFDVKDIVNQIHERAKKNSSMLHIFPCGNPGSFEYKLCNLRINGIDAQRENRFFFEAESHIRRMTTRQCAMMFERFKFALKKAYYSYQHYGAINWITKHNDIRLLFNMFNPAKGRDVKSKIKLIGMLLMFVLVSMLRKLAVIYDSVSKRPVKKKKHIAFFILFYVPSIFSRYFDKYIVFLAENEWNKRKTQENGSEMHLFFTRENNH